MVVTPTTKLPLQVRRLDHIQSYVIPDKNNTFGENCKHSSHLFRFILDFCSSILFITNKTVLFRNTGTDILISTFCNQNDHYGYGSKIVAYDFKYRHTDEIKNDMEMCHVF